MKSARASVQEITDAASPTLAYGRCGPAPLKRKRALDIPPAIDLREWRVAERRRLIDERMKLPNSQRARYSQKIALLLARLLVGANGQTIGFCWPFKGEPDLRDLMAGLSDSDNTIALPVVAERNQPLIFRSWKPGDPLDRGAWNIPVPRKGCAVQPDVILAPVVGFDSQGFRLGYGGGYFDRTLAIMTNKPIKYGVGHTISKIPTICPQSHDVPMNAIVTERGVIWPQLLKSASQEASPDAG